MIVAVGLGVAKGIRSVYMVLVIPGYVSIEKLPSASGIQMMTNGVILTCFGPLIGTEIPLVASQLLTIISSFVFRLSLLIRGYFCSVINFISSALRCNRALA